jgi:hypothetical protein
VSAKRAGGTRRTTTSFVSFVLASLAPKHTAAAHRRPPSSPLCSLRSPQSTRQRRTDDLLLLLCARFARLEACGSGAPTTSYFSFVLASLAPKHASSSHPPRSLSCANPTCFSSLTQFLAEELLREATASFESSLLGSANGPGETIKDSGISLSKERDAKDPYTDEELDELEEIYANYKRDADWGLHLVEDGVEYFFRANDTGSIRQGKAVGELNPPPHLPTRTPPPANNSLKVSCPTALRTISSKQLWARQETMNTGPLPPTKAPWGRSGSWRT